MAQKRTLKTPKPKNIRWPRDEACTIDLIKKVPLKSTTKQQLFNSLITLERICRRQQRTIFHLSESMHHDLNKLLDVIGNRLSHCDCVGRRPACSLPATCKSMHKQIKHPRNHAHRLPPDPHANQKLEVRKQAHRCTVAPLEPNGYRDVGRSREHKRPQLEPKWLRKMPQYASKIPQDAPIWHQKH